MSEAFRLISFGLEVEAVFLHDSFAADIDFGQGEIGQRVQDEFGQCGSLCFHNDPSP